MNVGDILSLELANIPDGLTAADYAWPVEAEHVLSVDETGTVTALKPGQQTMYAHAVYRNRNYYEYFPITVVSDISGISLNYPALNLLTGDTFTQLTVSPDGTWGMDEKPVTWSCTDSEEKYIELPLGGMDTYRKANQYIHAWNPGDSTDAVYPAEITLTAAWNDFTAECLVTVYDKRDPRQVLAYINAGGLDGFYSLDGGTVTLDGAFSSLNLAYDAAAVDAMGAEPAGKYAVLFTTDESSQIGFGFMALLPPEYLPERFEEVEYILRARQGEYIHMANYEGGAKGLMPTVEIVLENASSGETIEIIETLNGENNFPDKVWVADGAKDYISAQPAGSEIDAAFLRAIASLWAKSGKSVIVNGD